MPRPLTVPATRFFARVDRFTCECPACGFVIAVGLQEAPGLARRAQTRRLTGRKGVRVTPKKARQQVWNPLTSRVSCSKCGRTWAVGLVLYPVAERVISRQPLDTKPTWRQLLDIRQRAQGFLAEEAIRGNQEVNLAAVLECVCPEGLGGWAPACPVHGDERLKRARSEDDLGGESEPPKATG